jgi:hypothetical protein
MAGMMNEKWHPETIQRRAEPFLDCFNSSFLLDWMAGEVGRSLKPEDIDDVFRNARQRSTPTKP